MPGNTLHIRQNAPVDGKSLILLTLKRPGQPELEGQATIEFALTPEEQEDLRWYMEDYLLRAESVEELHVKQIENLMQQRGEELYNKVLTANQTTQAIWFAIREQLADLRVEITTGIAEAASIPWELMRDPQLDSAVALRVKSFVRVQSNPNISFIKVPRADDGRIRLLYIVCRPSGRNDVELRAVANRLLQGLGEDLARYNITALRPPTFEALQNELKDAKTKRRPYHIVHFDGHGVYAQLKDTVLEDWLKALSHLTLGGKSTGKHGFLLFESPGSKHKMRPVDGQTLGQLLHDNGVPILVLNACQSAMHEADAPPADAETVHDEVRAIGSLAQAVVDQGIPAVLGMRYSVFVVTAAQYIGELYRALAKGNGFGEAASQGRKHLHLNPERWVGLEPRPLQDWFVPVVYEAKRLQLLPILKPEAQAKDAQTGPSFAGASGLDSTRNELDAAEAAYQRSLALRDPSDALGRSRCVKEIGTVHYERFNEAHQQDEPPETLLQHVRAAEEHYQQALDLCPASAIADVGPIHNQLGILYKIIGQTEQAREHYEKRVQLAEQTGNRHSAAVARFNMALMYGQAAGPEKSRERRRELLLRAQAYAQAALRDYQHYQGRAAADEAKAQQLIDHIEQQLAQLPQ